MSTPELTISEPENLGKKEPVCFLSKSRLLKFRNLNIVLETKQTIGAVRNSPVFKRCSERSQKIKARPED